MIRTPLIAAVTLSACTAAEPPSEPESAPAAGTAIEAGQQIAMLLDADALAPTTGPEALAQFTVDERLIGEGNTLAVSVYALPKDADLSALPLGEGDRLLTSRAMTGTMIDLDPTKHHTLALAKLNPERPHDYQRYLEAVQPVVESVGGRFVHLMIAPNLATLEGSDPGAFPPQRAIIVEWDTVEALPNLFRSSDYKAIQPLLSTGTRGFEFYQLSME